MNSVKYAPETFSFLSLFLKQCVCLLAFSLFHHRHSYEIMKSISQDKQQNAKVLLRKGISSRNVSKELGVSVGAILRVRREDKENIPDPKMGPPSKVSKITKDKIVRQFNTGKLQSICEAQELVQSVEGVHVHETTIRSLMKDGGLKGYVKRNKPLLTKKHRKARLRFARDHENWTVEDWKQVMFSDEVLFTRVSTSGREFYYKRPGDQTIRPHHTRRTVQGGGGKIFIWGCITSYGVGDLCWLPGTINSSAYINILDDYVLASRDWNDMDPGTFIFQQDNASVHTAGAVKKFFEKKNIRVMEWPPNSPDLNIIENVWAHINSYLEKYNTHPKTLDELWERVQDIWTNISQKDLEALYESLPGRMKEVIKSKGDHTNH